MFVPIWRMQFKGDSAYRINCYSGSNNSSFFSDSLSFSAILSASLFMLLIFFLLNLALVLFDALLILSFKASIWDFRLLISTFRLLNFLASLKSLFCLHLTCLLVKGASNSDCLTSVCGSHCGSQVDVCRGGGGGGGGLEGLGGLCCLGA